MGYKLTSAVLCGVAACLLLSACGQAGKSPDSGTDPIGVDFHGLPAIPDDNSESPVIRAGSIPDQIVLHGRDAYQSLGSYVVDQHIVLESSSSTPSWAIYRFEGLSTASPFTVTVNGFDVDRLYCGYADYDTDRWVWSGDGSNPQTRTVFVDPAHETVSPAGNLYLVAVAYGGDDVDINYLTLQLDQHLPAPLQVTASQGTVPPVVLTWEDPAVSFDPDGSGPLEFVYDGVRVERAVAEDGPFEVIAPLVEQPATTYHDFENAAGESYFYRLSTVLAGIAGPAGEAVSGYGGRAPVAQFTVSPEVAHGSTSVALDATGSFDPEGGSIVEYRWSTWFAGDFSTGNAHHNLSGIEVSQSQLIQLTVVDEEGVESEPVEHWIKDSAPELIADDPVQPDPGDGNTMAGVSGNFSLDLYGIIVAGVGPFQLDLDTNYTGVFDPLVPNYGTPPLLPQVNAPGPFAVLDVAIPFGQPSGEYVFALRATDLGAVPPKTGILTWERRVILRRSFLREDFESGNLDVWTISGDQGTRAQDFVVTDLDHPNGFGAQSGSHYCRFTTDGAGYGNDVRREMMMGPIFVSANTNYTMSFHTNGDCQTLGDGLMVGYAFKNNSASPTQAEWQGEYYAYPRFPHDFIMAEYGLNGGDAMHSFGANVTLGGEVWRHWQYTTNSGPSGTVMWLRIKFVSDGTDDDYGGPAIDNLIIY